jgi:hypothetical protein
MIAISMHMYIVISISEYLYCLMHTKRNNHNHDRWLCHRDPAGAFRLNLAAAAAQISGM